MLPRRHVSSAYSYMLAFALLGTPWLMSSSFAQTPGIRHVSDVGDGVIPVQTRLRYTTLIVLPEHEEIIDVVCGDKDFWVISATHNLAHVKPAKENAATNLNLVTASGTVYSFLLSEKGGASTPDLKIYVVGDSTASPAKPVYYTAAQFDGLQTELVNARSAVETERRRATDAITAYQQAYPSTLRFVYGTPKYEKPFFVRAVWHDGRFTYLKTDATELPALYEMKDGEPSLVNFDVRDGTYVAPKVIDRAYLALGKARFAFAQQGR